SYQKSGTSEKTHTAKAQSKYMNKSPRRNKHGHEHEHEHRHEHRHEHGHAHDRKHEHANARERGSQEKQTAWEKKERGAYPVVKFDKTTRSKHIQKTVDTADTEKEALLADPTSNSIVMSQNSVTNRQANTDILSPTSAQRSNKRRYRNDNDTEDILEKDPGVVCMDILDLVRNGFTSTTMRETKIRLAGGAHTNVHDNETEKEIGYQFEIVKFKNEKFEKEIRNTISEIEKRQIESAQGWYHMWEKGSFLFTSIRTLAQPIIDNLISDDQRYVRVFEELSEREQMYLTQLKDHCDRIMRGKNQRTVLKQNETDIYLLLKCAYSAHQRLHKNVRFIAKNYRVRGQYEGDPGVKHVQRIVEKGLLEYIGEYDKKRYSDPTHKVDNLFSPSNVKIDYASVKDYARAGITCQGIQQIIEALRLVEKNSGIEIIRIKNRFDSPNKGGYKDILINIRFLDRRKKDKSSHRYGGHVCELQLHHEKYQIIRSEMNGHDNYSASRFMIDFVRQKALYSTNESDERKMQLIKLIQKLQ
ncbi:hypothetical protein RFI_00339, partial [Reticulomyxa filosa]